MVFHLTLKTCAPEAVTEQTTLGARAWHTDPYDRELRETVTQASFGALAAQDHRPREKGAAVYAYAEALKDWQAAVTGSERDAVIAAALDRVEAARDSNPDDADLEEIRTLLRVLE